MYIVRILRNKVTGIHFERIQPMKYWLLYIILMGLLPKTIAQLNCIVSNKENGDWIKTCYHKSGEPSTIETWDKDKRWGSMSGFNSQGKQLFKYDLRSFAGHSSIYLQYYPNGQVKRAEYSSAPDGGIQFWRIVHGFDESGNQTEYYDMSQPDGHPVIINTPDTSRRPYTTKTETFKQEVATCATPFITVFEISNETNRKVKVKMNALSNLYTQLKDTTIVLLPFQAVVVDSVILAEMFLKWEIAYKPELYLNPGKKSKQKIILSAPFEVPNKRKYTWYVIGRN